MLLVNVFRRLLEKFRFDANARFRNAIDILVDFPKLFIARIVVAYGCAKRNAELSVTGALISTRFNFAQLLEGPTAAVDALMDSIRRDPRHREVRVISTGPLARRQFASWSLAYAGPSTYVAAALEPLLDEGASNYDIRLLLRLMREFARKYGGKD